MAFTVLKNTKHTALVQATSNSSITVGGNEFASGIGYANTVVTDAKITQISTSSPSFNGGYWEIKRGANTIAVLDSTSTLDLRDIPLRLYGSASLSATLRNSASGSVLIELNKNYYETIGETEFIPQALFASSEDGAYYYPATTSSLFQESTGASATTQSGVGDVVGTIVDLSGNDRYATQATTSAKPIYQTSADRITIDGVDDHLDVTLPTIDGTMVLSTPEGTAAYGVNISAGSYEIGGRGGLYFPGSAIVGQIIRDGAMSSGGIDAALAFFRTTGGNNYGSVVDFSNYWRNWSELTSFPEIDTSNGTDFSHTWHGCSSLTSFPANFFDTCTATDFTSSFSGTALSQTSIDNILTSLDTAGQSGGTFAQSGGSAPSATGETAIDNLRASGWTVTVTGGY